MHRCLLISEIISKICLELSSDTIPYINQHPGSLAAFAITCRAISEPALDVLWHTHCSMTPLLKCMSEDLWDEREFDNEETYLYLSRPIVYTDWHRLKFYAKRIRVLGWKIYPSPAYNFIRPVRPEALQALVHSNPTPTVPLCPNIRSIDWSGMSDELFPYIRLFLGPNIKRLVVHLDDPDMTNLSIVYSLPRQYPGLTHADFGWTDDFHYHTISETVCQWNCLESFIWNDGELTHRALIHLANLPNLQNIEIFIPELGEDWLGGLSTSRQSGFCALRKAHFRCNRVSSCLSLMDLASSQCPLETMVLAINTNNDYDSISMMQFFDMLNARCSHTTLTTLSVTCGYHHWPTPPYASQNIIDEDTLRPLLAFPHMSDVVMHIGLPFRLGNGMLRDIVACWTQLRSLIIGTSDGWGGQSQITLTGLIPLLSLSNLEVLRIAFDASINDDSALVLPSASPNTKVRSLELADSVIYNAYPVAAFLSDVFPNLRKIDSWSDAAARNASVSMADGKKYRSRWGKVVSLMKATVKVRKQKKEAALP